MSKRKRLFILVAIGLAAALILPACSPGASPAAPATLTAASQSPLPTATGMASPTASALPTATVTEPPTATLPEPPTIAPTNVTVAQVLTGWNAYCRMGPGTYYYAVTFLQAGNPYPVVGRDGLDIWWQVQVTPKVQCWEGDPTSTKEGPVESAPVVLAPPLPSSPSLFGNTSHCDPVMNTMTVWLTWTSAQGASGYHIYRNGSLIVQLGPKANSYTDKAPRSVDLKYQIEALNDYGVAPRLETQIRACV